MFHVLIAYFTREGQTARIARVLLKHLRDLKVDAVCCDLETEALSLEGGAWDAVILGASIHRGHYPKELRQWIGENRAALRRLPLAFYSVSLGAASDDPEERAEARRLAETFVHEQGLEPRFLESVAGALRYQAYGPLTRWMMRRIAAKEGGGTDVTRDYEYTDWDQVRGLAEGLARFLELSGNPEQAHALGTRDGSGGS